MVKLKKILSGKHKTTALNRCFAIFIIIAKQQFSFAMMGESEMMGEESDMKGEKKRKCKMDKYEI